MRLPFRKKPQQPKQPNQLKQTYDLTKELDPTVTYWCAAAFFLPLLLGFVLAFTVGPPFVFLVIGFLGGVLLALVTLGLRARKAMYSSMQGQEGAAGGALATIRKGFSVEEEPVAIDMRTHDMVFRAVGRAGVVLVTEGPTNRVKKLVDAEKKKLARVAPNAPVHVIHSGEGDGQVRLNKLAGTVQKLKPQMTREEADAVTKRLKSLGGIKPPIPKGMDPNRMGVNARRARRR